MHFEYTARLERFAGREREWRSGVRNVALYGFALEGLGSVWKFFPGMRELRVLVDDDDDDDVSASFI